MAQTGFTPIQIYYSTTTTNVPSAGNLTDGELAINTADGKLFYKDNLGVVRVIAQTSSVTNVASISFGTTGLTPSTATTGAVTVAGTLATTNGGTGLTSFTANRVFYASSTSAIGQSANLTFDGTTLTANNFTDSSLTSGRVTYATTGGNLTDSANLLFDGTTLTANALTTTSTVTINGGTANGVAYLNGSKVLTTGSALTFDGTNLVTKNVNLGLPGTGTNHGTETYVLSASNPGTYYQNLDYIANRHAWFVGASALEGMRLTSTGLGIGTSSPGAKLDVQPATYTFGTAQAEVIRIRGNASGGTTTSPTSVGALVWGNGTITQAVINSIIDNPSASSRSALAFSTNIAGTLTEAMRLDSSGNLGLGVTPSAWLSGWRALQVGGGSGNGGSVYTNAGGTTGQIGLAQNWFFDGSNNLYITSAAASDYYQFGGAHVWRTAGSGTAGNPISFTQAMTLDASGRLGLGTTSPGYPVDIVADSSTWTANFRGRSSDNVAYVRFSSNNGATTYAAIGSPAANTLGFDTGGSERARITSGGYFCVGSTTDTRNIYAGGDNSLPILTVRATAASGVLNGINANFSGQAPNNTTSFFLQCNDTGAERATIRSNGGIANYQGNDVNLSDRREKTNFAPAKDYLDTICAIPVQTFNYIDQSEDDPGLTLGVVAQDVQAVAPELVMESNWGTKEDPKMRLSIYQTDLQYALMKCIQELKAQNDDLRARVAQLEAK